MIATLKTFLENLNWFSILSSLVVNLIAIYAAYKSIKSCIRRKMLFRIKKNKEGLCALSIGLGKNDPYQAVIDYMGEQNKDKVIKFYKSHEGNSEDDLTIAEVESALNEINIITGKLRRDNFKEVLVFFAGPLAAAAQVGYLFKNFLGVVKFMQYDRKAKQYIVMSMPQN